MLIFSFLALLQSISISALDVGLGAESVDVVRTEPPAPVPIVTIRVRLCNIKSPKSIIQDTML